ncbi:aminotransferase class V-fold PLP-dependent enzyme [Thalassobius sp. MITS945101]|uniref:aminotransferase class V-fold PLP-dependent enzyme n=1 Tax=Thalassobius sp. MITS945101 TaxID=3096994 RepID=UPI00399A8540
MTLSLFRQTVETAKQDGSLWEGVIGEGAMIPGLYGDVALTYADYVASGRALRQVETYVQDHVLPFYANSHTESSFTGAHMTRLRNEARAEIGRVCGAGEDDAVIFAGSGATAGLNRLIALFGVERANDPVVLIGPYEHHSNILPWRETKARIIEIPEAEAGGPCMAMLEQVLHDNKDSDLVIGSFSAASNVTGIVTDTAAVTRLLKAHGALSVWDYAGGGPYLPIDMMAGTDAQKDAIVVSPHKFPGGPGASGVMIVNKDAVTTQTPSWPGGGTVTYVSSWGHDYSQNLEAREEAGTPNIIGDIRAALAFVVKDVIGTEEIARREEHYAAMALKGWKDNPRVQLLGTQVEHRLPIFSFLVRDAEMQVVSPLLFTMMLSDIHGVQVRGGCSCAGPYGHRLLGIGEEMSHQMRDSIRAGDTREKPGWVRLNFSYMMEEATVARIIKAVNDLSIGLSDHIGHYVIDAQTGQPRRVEQAA